MRLALLLPTLIVLSAGLFGQSVSENERPNARATEPELISPLGRRMDAAYDEQGLVQKVTAALAENPGDPDALLSAGQAYSTLYQFKNAIAMYTRGIFAAPSDPRFYRYRGHRQISLRHFDEAVADLEKAKSIAPDSFEVAYYLGLARYFKGDFAAAAKEIGGCLDKAGQQPAAESTPVLRPCFGISDEVKAALTAWKYLALVRAGDAAAAADVLQKAPVKFQVQETEPYHRAIEAFRGQEPADGLVENPINPTIAYPAAQVLLQSGERLKACVLLKEIVKADDWSALGLIAAEADLARHQVCK